MCCDDVQGLKKYLSDPAAALQDSADHMKVAIRGTPVEGLAKSLAEAAGQQDEGLVMVGVTGLGLLIGLFIIGAVNIVTGVGFAVPAYSTLQIMQGSNAEKDIMAKMVPVRAPRTPWSHSRSGADTCHWLCACRCTGSCFRVF